MLIYIMNKRFILQNSTYGMQYSENTAVVSKHAVSINELLMILSTFNDEGMTLQTAEIFEETPS